MFDLFLSSLPRDALAGVKWASLAAAVVGGVLWLFGSRFSQAFLALAGVGAGAWLGLKLPAWFSLPIGGWASACAAALILGLLGYVLDRLWVGIGLGLLLAAWAAFGMLVNHKLYYAFPAIQPHQSATEYLATAYRHVPDHVRRILPVMAGLTIGATLAMMLWLPRASLYLFYSLFGVTCLAVFGLAVARLSRASLLRIYPDRQTTQLLVALGMTLFGFVVQWRLSTAGRPAKSGGSKPASKS
jgi:hypothetical protein